MHNISSADNSFYPFSPIKTTSNLEFFQNGFDNKNSKYEKLEHIRSATEPNIINLTKVDNNHSALSFNEEDSEEYINLIQEKEKEKRKILQIQ